MRKCSVAFVFILANLLLSQTNAFGDVAACGCVCGKVLRAPCTEDDCRRACGYGDSSAPSSGPAYDYEAERQRQEAERQRQLELERQRQQELEEQRKKAEEEARRRREDFERNKQEALKSMKGISEGELGLKGTDAGELGLKDIGDTKAGLGLKEFGDATVVDLRDKKKPYVMDLDKVKGSDFGIVKVQHGVSNPGKLRQELLIDFSNTILTRTEQPNKQAQAIVRSFKTGEPPNPIKNIADLAPGDVILVAPWPWKDRNKVGYSEVGKSLGINFLDKWGSNNWSSPASHTAIFLGERNGKRWYMDNTSNGPLIKEEKDFMKEYGGRKMDVATMVGQPLSKHEGEELWKGAHELRNTTTYWPSGVPNVGRVVNGNNEAGMVCSEASRWMLMRAGRRVPETHSEDAKVLGKDIGLNKKQIVSFSPSDFYEEQQYFVIHQLGTQRKGQKP